MSISIEAHKTRTELAKENIQFFSVSLISNKCATLLCFSCYKKNLLIMLIARTAWIKENKFYLKKNAHNSTFFETIKE